MSKKTPGIKIPYFRADQYPVVEGFRCVEILIPDTVENMALLAGLLKLPGRSFNWQGDDEKRYELAQTWRNAYDATDWESCMDCESLIACLQPLFDALTAQVESLQETVDEVQATQEENAAAERALAQSTLDDELCGAATGIVEAMDGTNRKTYAETEAGVVDNVFELVQRFLSAIPIFGSLPFDELFGLVNWMFENQVLEYSVDYDLIKDQMICDLKCFVQANDNEFTWDVWADWLDYVGEQYPDNRAAGLFSRFSPTRQTWINQIAASLNKDASLQSYFDSLSVAWEGGLLNPSDCSGCACPDGMAEQVGLLNTCGAGVLATYPFVLGTPFEVPSIEQDSNHHQVVLKLPPGDYNIEVSGFTGSVGANGANVFESAWGYIDLLGALQNMTWNDGGAPDTFGDQDTTAGIFSGWCAGQEFNIMLNNGFEFTVEIVVTAA